MDESLLHARFPALRETLPHVRLGEPTPVSELKGLEEGSAPIWLKDDGRYGSGPWGGNKVRKLEWILPDAKRRHRGSILTFGGLGTNHGLATALYGREQGLRVAIALVDQPVDDHVRAQLERLRRSGARLYLTHGKARTIAALPWMILRNASGGRPPYVLYVGGSTPVGALGYVEGALELAGQVEAGELPEPSHVVVAVGSGGTAAGLALGLRIAGLRTRVVGVVVADAVRLDAEAISSLASRSARLLRQRGAELPAGVEPTPADVTMESGWLGAGYGHRTEESEHARALAAEREDLRLDPVYTAKTMAGLLELNAQGAFGDGPVLYIHTDGPREATRA